MKKHKSEEALYERMRNLAEVNKTSLKESQNRTLGTLIDTKRAANGVAYGIVKEQHKYYIKKGGLNENQNVADFAYIGGLSNITDYQYDKLSEAEKQMNFLLKNINEGISSKMNKNGSKIESKKVLTEDKASQEIEMAASKVDDLDAATDAAEVPAEPEMEMPPAEDGGEGAAEMDAGIDAMPDGNGEELPAEDGGEELPAEDDSEEMPDGEELPADDGGEKGEDEGSTELQQQVSNVAKDIQDADLDKGEIKWLLDRFLRAFLPVEGVSENINEGEENAPEPKNKMAELDIDDRKELADMILKVVPPEEIEDLGQNVEDTSDGEIEEEKCTECGFAKYAESRGYNAESIKEIDEEEMTNLISGYANNIEEPQGDGELKVVALFVTPEILEKLKGEYGHEDFANQVEPFSNEMNETTTEDRDAQINELFGGLKNLAKDAGQGIKRGAQNVAQKVGDAATAVKQSYHTGELPKEVKKLEGFAAQLGQQIGALNKRMEKAGKQPINVQSILTTIKNQIAGGGNADLSKYATNEEGIPVDHTQVQPMMEDNDEISSDNIDSEESFRNYATTVLKKAHGEDYDIEKAEYMIKGLVNMTKASDEENWGDAVGILQQSLDESSLDEEVDIKVSEKQGKKLSPDNTPEVEMKEGVEEKEEELNIDDLDVGEEGEDTSNEDNFDLTKRKEPEMGINSGFESMGGGVIKPEGAETTTVEVTKGSVNVSLNETETKLRKYIRNRLEEHAGIRKPSLNESKKTETIQKLDRIIDKQFKLFESELKKKVKR